MLIEWLYNLIIWLTIRYYRIILLAIDYRIKGYFNSEIKYFISHIYL